jgi:hypothetical protein
MELRAHKDFNTVIYYRNAKIITVYDESIRCQLTVHVH